MYVLGKKISGITLIEVLVTLVIISIGLLALVSLQLYSVQSNDSSLRRSQATFLAYDILERMRLNRSEAMAGDYDFDNISSASPSTFSSPSSDVEVDLNMWVSLISQTLPEGQGKVDCDNSTLRCDIAIQWNDTRSRYSGDKCGDNDPACFKLESKL